MQDSQKGYKKDVQPDLLALLEELKAGESEAFERFFGLVEQRVRAFGLKVCGPTEDAEDTLQDTLLRAFKALPNLDFQDTKALNVWLYKVAKNSCLMMRRKYPQSSEQEISLDQLLPDGAAADALPEIPDWSQLPEDVALRNELTTVIRQATLALPLPYRLVLVLRDMEQLSTREVAEALEISEQNVKIRLHRARLFLRQELEHYVLDRQLAKTPDQAKQ